MRIEDGKGKNGYASVDVNQKLEVAAESADIMYHKSKNDNTVYVQYSKRNFATTNDEGIFHLTYTGSGTLCIGSAVVASNAANCKIEFFKNPVYTSGGDLRPAINLNFSSAIPSSTTCYISDTTAVVMTTDPVEEMMDVRLSSPGDTTETVEFKGAIRMQKGDTFGAIGAVTATASSERVRISLYMWEE